jgi:hypothetical protein
MTQTSVQALTTVKEINQACKTGRVFLAWKNGEPTGSRIYQARTINGTLMVQLRRGDTGRRFWQDADSYLVYQGG